MRVVCVDNGSTDGSVEAVRDRHPEAHLIENGRNLGFSGGCNVGIRWALDQGAGWVVLVNNDATIAPDAIQGFAAAAERHPRAGILAGKVLLADRPDRIWFAGQRFLAWLGYSGRHRGEGRRDGPRYSRDRSTDRATGALMAVSRRMIEQVGLLDEGLFAYLEDVDWSLRAREAGFEVVFVPSARAWHRVGASTQGPAHNSYYGTRNMIEVCERHRPLPPPLSWLRRGVIRATFAAYALRQPNRRAAWPPCGRATATLGQAGSDPARSMSGLRRVGLNLLFMVPGETGGAEIYVRNLVPKLAEARPDLDLVAFVNREGTGLELGGAEPVQSTSAAVPRQARALRAAPAAAPGAPARDRPAPQPRHVGPAAARRRQRGDDPRRDLRPPPGGAHPADAARHAGDRPACRTRCGSGHHDLARGRLRDRGAAVGAAGANRRHLSRRQADRARDAGGRASRTPRARGRAPGPLGLRTAPAQEPASADRGVRRPDAGPEPLLVLPGYETPFEDELRRGARARRRRPGSIPWLGLGRGPRGPVRRGRLLRVSVAGRGIRAAGAGGDAARRPGRLLQAASLPEVAGEAARYFDPSTSAT